MKHVHMFIVSLSLMMVSSPLFAISKVLIFAETVSNPPTSSNEYIACINNGYLASEIDIAYKPTWSNFTSAQFANYQTLVLGDPFCAFPAVYADLEAIATTWTSIIDGNIIIIGTDPTVHGTGGAQLIDSGIAFALSHSNPTGTTSAYITLSCYYHYYIDSSVTPQQVKIIDGLGGGNFFVRNFGCFNDAHIVLTHPALNALTDGDLSNWGCSVHEAFTSYPGTLIELGIALNAGGNPYTAPDGTQGVPYILAQGEGLEPIPTDPECKWRQMPDINNTGIDIRFDINDGQPRKLADDFKCIEPGYIDQINFWGSWNNDNKGDIEMIHIEFWSDMPANSDSYSYPLEKLWECDIYPGGFTEKEYHNLCVDPDNDCNWEWWWDVIDSTVPANPQGDQIVWKYEVPFDPAACELFWQEGTPDDPEVYWLAIYVRTTGGILGFPSEMGWKTSRNHWNDDGVMMSPLLQPDGRLELIYPPGHPFTAAIDPDPSGEHDHATNSIDLAFEIKSTPQVDLDACCYINPIGVPTCTDLVITECLKLGGTPYPGASCTDTNFECPTPDPLEACCLPDGTCVTTTVGDCMVKHGIPQGAGTDCTTPGIDCPPAPDPEACCLPDGTCADLLAPECLLLNGIPQGVGTNCTAPTFDCPTPPDPNEACCLPDGTCQDLTPDECKEMGGLPQGLGSNCDTTDCPIPPNGPCMPDAVVCDNGLSSVGVSYSSGATDNFNPIWLDSAPTPNPMLLNYITSCSAPGIPLAYDEIPGESGVPANSWFGHTFTGLPGNVVGAFLEIRIRATNGTGSTGTNNDHISIVDNVVGCVPSWYWQRRIKKLPEAIDNKWMKGETATFCLDLDHLPIGNGGATKSILNDINTDGEISIRVDDDSGVDYVRLHLVFCECLYPINVVITAETPDGFSLPDSEPASPSNAMTMYYFPSTLRGFDRIQNNKWFGHTFVGIPAGIVGAELEIGLKAHADLATNDTINLSFLNPGYKWGKYLKDLPLLPGGTPIGSWPNGSTSVFKLDLDNLLPSGTLVTSVLDQMAGGKLDVFLQDDTAVDYMILRVKSCCDATGIPGDIDHDFDVDVFDLAIMSKFWMIGTLP